MSATSQLARLLALVPWLRAHPGVAPSVVADEFGISLQQLEDDLNLLIVSGVPGGQHGQLFDIQFWADDDDPGEDPGEDANERVRLGPAIHVLDAQTLDRPMQLTLEEVTTLIVGLSLLRDLPGRFDRDDVDLLVARLERLMPAGQGASVAVVPSPPLDESISRTVIDAVGRHRLAIRYLVPSRDEITDREVDPLRVSFVDGERYLIAYCHLAQSRRTFRLDRIVAAQALDTPIASPPTEPVAEIAEALGDLQVDLVLQPTARWIAEYAVVDATTERNDGVLEVRLRTDDLRWVAALILGAGGGVRIVAPSELQELVMHKAQRGMDVLNQA